MTMPKAATAHLHTCIEELTQALNEMEAAAGEHCPEEIAALHRSVDEFKMLVQQLESQQ